MAIATSPALKTARFSQQFLSAALKIQAPARTDRAVLVQRPSLVAYYLVGHAIELAFKSYLLIRGVSGDDLRSRDYGHKLGVLMTECRKRRLGLVVKLTANELNLIRRLSETYAAKELEYQFGGSRALPEYAALVDVADKLSAGMFEYAKTRG